jgi:hypothetical protein
VLKYHFFHINCHKEALSNFSGLIGYSRRRERECKSIEYSSAKEVSFMQRPGKEASLSRGVDQIDLTRLIGAHASRELLEVKAETHSWVKTRSDFATWLELHA